jgi:hypothetical protein
LFKSFLWFEEKPAYIILIFENRTMKPVEIGLRMGEGRGEGGIRGGEFD